MHVFLLFYGSCVLLRHADDLLLLLGLDCPVAVEPLCGGACSYYSREGNSLIVL